MAERIKLTQISSQSFEHPADRAALEALKKTVGFDRLMRAIAKFGMDKIWRIINESSNIRLSDVQVGSIYKLHLEAAEALDMEPPPLYLAHDVRVNAYTAGVQEPFIVVTSGLVEGFSDDEIRCVLGHEMGHILADHVLYKMVAASLGQILAVLGNQIPGLGPLIKLTLFASLMYWSRCAELTADRAGLLAVQDLETALSTEMKLGSGPGSRIAKELNLEAFMKQAREFEYGSLDQMDSVWRVLIEFDRSHPFPVVRASELDKWVKAGFYDKILEGHYVKRAKNVVADGARPEADPSDATEALAAEAEEAVIAALGRTYGVHIAPRIPSSPLQAALGSFVGELEDGERVLAFYDQTLSGNGDKGIVLTDRRVFSSNRKGEGVYYRDISVLTRSGGGLLSGPGLSFEGLELRFHTRAVRDAFLEALMQGATAFRSEPPRVE